MFYYDVSFRYKLLPEVGRGSFGIVRKVQDKRTKKYFACKTLSKEMNTPIHLLLREIASLEGIHHPNVIELQAVYEESRYIHIVTELCTGGELYERVSAGNWSITETEAAELMHNILRATAYCHSHGIIHRDLKASNFLFVSPDTNTDVKIIDFGLARAFSRTGDRPDDHDGTMDESAWVMKSKVGTPYYVAPEILTEEYYTSKCDVWSIGVVAYLVLSGGSLPFCGKDERETLQLLKDPELEVKFDPLEPWNDFDESAKDFCIALLQKDPARRPPAEEALQQKWLCENYTRYHLPDPALASNPKLMRHQKSSFRGRKMIDKIKCFRNAKSLGA
jgi:calcium-dependent protein kinase